MAVSREPILKRCRYLGISPMVMGISKESNRNPGANNRKKVPETAERFLNTECS